METAIAILYILCVIAVANSCYYGVMYVALYKVTKAYRWAGDKRTALWMLGLSLGLALMTLPEWHRLLKPLMGTIHGLIEK